MKRLLRTPIDERDAGLALPLVIGVTAVLAILLVASISYAVGTLRKSGQDEEWSAALAAAYAGVEEYQSRIAEDTTYSKFGNPASTFSRPYPGTPGHPDNSIVTLPVGAATNPAFGVGPGGSWAVVPGSDGEARYRYEVDNSKTDVDGSIRLRVTGLSGGETRSIVAQLRQQEFIDYLYFTDYEIQDPELSGAPVASCVKYAWQGRPAPGGATDCHDIAFGSNDQIYGPLHSNDRLRICDATFHGPVTTGWDPGGAGLRYLKQTSEGASCSGQVFNDGAPVSDGQVPMPPTNSQMKRETRTDLATQGVPEPGCLYTGPTVVQFNNNGTMTVRSPWTKKTQVAGDPPTSGTAPAMCGAVGTASGQLGHSGGATIPVPATNVVYVQNVPTAAGDPNRWDVGTTPAGITCGTGAMGGNGLGFPRGGEVLPLGATSTNPAYGCRNGDVFVKGIVDGAVTLASENYVYITGDLTYENHDEDILGLVGNDAVFIYNPVSAYNSSAKMLTDTNRHVDAAILSVAHTFQVQNNRYGGYRGDLTIHGAIAQKFRGVVRATVGSTHGGYVKKYYYDQRFTYMAPPKFLSPISATYEVSAWVEVSPIFGSDGAYS